MDRIVYVVCDTPSIRTLMEERRAKVHPETRGLDVFFNLSGPVRLLGSDTTSVPLTYSLDLGITLYTDGPWSDFLLLPRSSSSALSQEGLPFHPEFDVVDYEKTLKEAGVSFFCSHNMKLANTIGLIDFDYRGKCMARVEVNKDCDVNPSKPYFQLVALSSVTYKLVSSLEEVPELFRKPITRDSAGFGTTDKK